MARRILIVEPEMDVKFLVSEIISSEGYTVITAPTAAVARELMAENQICGAVVEAMLRDEIGRDLGSDFAEAGLPVLMMTGHPEGVKLLEASSLQWIRKPFRVAMFVQRLQQVMGDQNRLGVQSHEH